jgi:hypothetical protein
LTVIVIPPIPAPMKTKIRCDRRFRLKAGLQTTNPASPLVPDGRPRRLFPLAQKRRKSPHSKGASRRSDAGAARLGVRCSAPLWIAPKRPTDKGDLPLPMDVSPQAIPKRRRFRSACTSLRRDRRNRLATPKRHPKRRKSPHCLDRARDLRRAASGRLSPALPDLRFQRRFARAPASSHGRAPGRRPHRRSPATRHPQLAPQALSAARRRLKTSVAPPITMGRKTNPLNR